MSLSIFWLVCIISIFNIINLYASSDSSSSSSDDDKTDTNTIQTTTITAQLFCDNTCTFYFNNEIILVDEAPPRAVFEFEFEAPINGKRTFAIYAADFPEPFDGPFGEFGIWNFNFVPELLKDGTLDSLYCLGEGGIKGVFKDELCGQTVITDDNWKCEVVQTGPLDADQCFAHGFFTNPTFEPVIIREAGQDGNPFDYDLFFTNPCIENDGSVEILSDQCSENINDFDENWFEMGYDDSHWLNAVGYSDEEALPRGGRGANQNIFDPNDCNENQYCFFDIESWENGKVIWSDDRELDNIVLCRFEYYVDCDSDSESDSDESHD